MDYSVGSVWVIYIVAVVISYVVFWLLMGSVKRYYDSISYGTAFLLATVIGAVAVFIGAGWLDPNQLNDTDKTWLSVLFLMAFLLPIFAILYLVWAGEHTCLTTCNSYDPCSSEVHVKQTVHCDNETGTCRVTKRKIYQGDNITKVLYS